jgi:PIN domain nuclease of toxin-antitoxin system
MARNRQPVVFLDTHIAVWLYAGLVEKISDNAKQAIDSCDVLISPLVRLELQYLYEIGRITVKPDTIIKALFKAIGLKISETSLQQIIDEALKIRWTRDVFDRLLSAEAKLLGEGLITADETIRSNLNLAVW